MSISVFYDILNVTAVFLFEEMFLQAKTTVFVMLNIDFVTYSLFLKVQENMDLLLSLNIFR